MTKSKLATLSLGLFALVGFNRAWAYTDFSKCVLPKTVKTTLNLADIPAPILAQMPGLGAADGPIRTDALLPNDTRPTTRLAGAFSRRGYWVIAYETGGFANTRMVAIFSLSDDGGKMTLLGRHIAPQEGGICAVLETAFSGSSQH